MQTVESKTYPYRQALLNYPQTSRKGRLDVNLQGSRKIQCTAATISRAREVKSTTHRQACLALLMGEQPLLCLPAVPTIREAVSETADPSSRKPFRPFHLDLTPPCQRWVASAERFHEAPSMADAMGATKIRSQRRISILL